MQRQQSHFNNHTLLKAGIGYSGSVNRPEHDPWKSDADAHLIAYPHILELEKEATDATNAFNDEAGELINAVIKSVKKKIPTEWDRTGTPPKVYSAGHYENIEHLLQLMFANGQVPDLKQSLSITDDGKRQQLTIASMFAVDDTDKISGIITAIIQALDRREIWDALNLLRRSYHDAEEAIQKFNEAVSRIINEVESDVPLEGECELYRRIYDRYYSILEKVGGHRNLDEITKG